jgi:hypothetical protein
MSKYLFSAKEYPFYFEFKVIKRKKMKSKAMIDRKVYKSFPYGNNRSVLENMCDNSQLLTNGFKEITKEVAENMVNDAKEFEKEEWNTDEYINENAIFFKLNKDGSNQQILDRHTASIVIQNGKKTRIPSYDLVEIISKIAEVADYDLLVGKLNGYSIINYPPTLERCAHLQRY